MTRLFVTATGTDIGKSFVTASLAATVRRQGKSVLALKPVASGFDPDDWADSDPGVLLRAQGLGAESLDRVAPFRFRAPLSPDMAAAREGRALDFDAVTRFCRTAIDGPDEAVLVEGVGGVMVPLDDRHTVLDWIAALKIPALLVAGSYLGTISHTLTALVALAGRDCPVRAVVISESAVSPVPPEETAAAIRRFAPGMEIVIVGRHAVWEDVTNLAPLLG